MVPKRLYGISIVSCIRSQKSGDLTCIAAEASTQRRIAVIFREIVHHIFSLRMIGVD